MALKIVRQPGHIAVIGAPSSAGAHNPGMEKAPAAFRAAGLLDRLRDAGFTVTDLGDLPVLSWQADEESPRARNLKNVVAALNALRPQVEIAAKSGALVLVLGGECTLSLATLAGLRRYYRSVNLLWLDSDADLNVPATSPSGIVNGMVVAHIIGRGAPELVRFWGEPPLVREPDVVLFGLDRLDPPEAALLERSPMKRYTAAEILRRGMSAAVEEALSRMFAAQRDFVVHLDLDFISGDDLPAVDFPGSGGIRLDDARVALEAAAKQPHLLALQVASFNPEMDPDGTAARKIVEMLVSALSARFSLSAPALPAKKSSEKSAAAKAETVPALSATPVSEELPTAASEPQSWTSESLERTADIDEISAGESSSTESPKEPGE